MLEPVKLTTEELVAVLQDMAARIEAGDSWEGNFFYTAIGERFEDLESGEWEVHGVYRIGNADGSQGGVRMLGNVSDTPSDLGQT